MALTRRSGQRFATNIWPGFVDAMTALLLVMMFVLSIFMIVQFVLRETISNKDHELDALSSRIISLSEALGLEQETTQRLTADLGRLRSTLDDTRADLAQRSGQVSALQGELAEGRVRIAAFEERVAALLLQNQSLTAAQAGLEAEKDQLLSESEALTLALATARSEIDAAQEAARLDAAKREALEALAADLRAEAASKAASLEESLALLASTRAELSAAEGGRADLAAQLDDLLARFSDEEAARLAEAAAAEALRKRLENAQAELTAMELALDQKRQEAEDTLTLLAAAERAREALDAQVAQEMSERERQAALLAQANALLSKEEAASAEDQRQLALLNEQTAELRRQLSSLQGLLDLSKEEDAAAQVQIQNLGRDLNTALARAAAEERRRAELEAAERARAEAEATNLQRFKSEFFGQLRSVLEGREGVQIVGDRFIFSSEVLFDAGSADLGLRGQEEVAQVAGLLREIADQIPPGIDWILRVDGHTDNVPLSGEGRYADNWELSQARALSVVRYLNEELGIPANRLAANGFGEFQPLNTANTPEARAQNRRIELKFTER